MTTIDQFESVFKSAVKLSFKYEKLRLERIMIVTDLDREAAGKFRSRVQGFLSVLENAGAIDWRVVAGEEFQSIGELLQLVTAASPDLICTYRALHSTAWRWPHTLGEHLDVLTQKTEVPVLVLPHPQNRDELQAALENTDSVMAMTDHLTGDHRLVNYSLLLTQPKGRLHLANVVDDRAFRAYVEAIEKIPAIDTETVEEALLAQLEKEPHDYIVSVRAVCNELQLEVDLAETVTLGRHLSEYRRLVEEHEVDLLVLNTKDEDQLAMHGLAYPLAVELTRIPLLML